MSRRLPDVVVVGGGVIGLAVAWRLARRDARVTLLERHAPGAGASTAAAGMLSPLKEAGEPGPFLDLGLGSLERYPEFVAEIESCAGMTVGYRREGRLDVAFAPDAAEGLRRQAALQEEAGFESRLMEPAELRRLEPLLADDVLLGLATAHDHQLDNGRLVRALWLSAQREGVEIRTGAGVAGMTTDGAGGRVSGLVLDSGETIDAETVVIAAGAWSGAIGLPHPLPVRPVRGQIVVLEAVPPVVGRVTWGPGCYLVPREDGRLLVGATMEEAGFVLATTADATRRLLECAIRTVPAIAGAAIRGFQVGLRPASVDGLPVLGPDPSTPGLFTATGHFRNGVLLAPETAEIIARAVLDGQDVDPSFSPARFHQDTHG